MRMRTKKAKHLPPIPPEMQDAIQLLSLLNKSKTSLSSYEKIVKWKQSSKSATESKKMPTRKEVLKFLTNSISKWSHAPKCLHFTINWIVYRCSCPSHFGLHICSVNFIRMDEIWTFDFQRSRKFPISSLTLM